jgi:hypothetical protein
MDLSPLSDWCFVSQTCDSVELQYLGLAFQTLLSARTLQTFMIMTTVLAQPLWKKACTDPMILGGCGPGALGTRGTGVVDCLVTGRLDTYQFNFPVTRKKCAIYVRSHCMESFRRPRH